MIDIVQTNLLNKGVVLINWPYQCDWKIFKMLQSDIAGLFTINRDSCDMLCSKSILLHSIYKLCELKINANPKDMKKNKYSNINIEVFNDTVILSLICHNNYSNIIKNIKDFLSVLKPDKTENPILGCESRARI